MGGHGGLNILPQKSWNVYNYENREKVRRDEEAAAREEQIKRDQSRRRDSEIRLDRLRQVRGLPSSSTTAAAAAAAPTQTLAPPSSDSRHINLFDAAQDFSSLASAAANEGGNARKFKREEKEDGEFKNGKKQRRKERPSAAELAALEDEKYKLGYGLAGKGVKAPWYLSIGSSMKSDDGDVVVDRRGCNEIGGGSCKKKGSGKKSIEELREERLRREKQEKEREQALFASMAKKEKGFSRRRF